MPETLRIDLRPFFAKFAETPAALKSTLPAPTAAATSTPPLPAVPKPIPQPSPPSNSRPGPAPAQMSTGRQKIEQRVGNVAVLRNGQPVPLTAADRQRAEQARQIGMQMGNPDPLAGVPGFDRAAGPGPADLPVQPPVARLRTPSNMTRETVEDEAFLDDPDGFFDNEDAAVQKWLANYYKKQQAGPAQPALEPAAAQPAQPSNPVVANTATPQPGQSAAQPNTTTNSPPLASQAATQPGVNGQKSPAQQPPVAAPAAPVAPAAPAGPYDHAKTMAVLQDPKTPPEERHASGRAFAQHLMSTNAVKPEDTAAARAMAEGNFTPESEAWLNQASDRFKQESATQNPSLLSSPKGYGQLVGMWDALGPMGQLAFGVGVPAAMISLLGGGGVMSLLGGLGIVGAGLGAAGTGMLGDTAQAEAGRFMGNMGNFLGAIPNEARNANIFDANSPKSKELEALVKKTYLTEGPEAAQKLIDAQTAQFAPLEKMYQMHPGLAHSMLMGMENGPKTRAEADALYQQVSGRVNEARQPDFLANKARQAVVDEVTGMANNAGNTIRGWFGQN